MAVGEAGGGVGGDSGEGCQEPRCRRGCSQQGLESQGASLGEHRVDWEGRWSSYTELRTACISCHPAGLQASGPGELSAVLLQSNLVRFTSWKRSSGVRWRARTGWLADEESGRNKQAANLVLIFNFQEKYTPVYSSPFICSKALRFKHSVECPL